MHALPWSCTWPHSWFLSTSWLVQIRIHSEFKQSVSRQAIHLFLFIVGKYIKQKTIILTKLKGINDIHSVAQLSLILFLKLLCHGNWALYPSLLILSFEVISLLISAFLKFPYPNYVISIGITLYLWFYSWFIFLVTMSLRFIHMSYSFMCLNNTLVMCATHFFSFMCWINIYVV